MYRNRKVAAIFVVAAALVLALIFAVGHSRAATDKGAEDKTTATSDSSSATGGKASGADVAGTFGKEAGVSHASGASGSSQTANGNDNSNGSTTTTPPTTTPPGGGGHKPPFRFPIDQVGNLGLDKNPGTPPTTTPPNHNPVGGSGTGCVHKQGFACP